MKSIPLVIGAAAIAALAYEVRRLTIANTYTMAYRRGIIQGAKDEYQAWTLALRRSA